MSEILSRLAHVLEQRRTADPACSYVADLYRRGTDAIVDKISEESTELIMAAKHGDHSGVLHETADLWFHTLVLLSHEGLTPTAVLGELARRFGRSGFAEKAARLSSGGSTQRP